jgi:hypothetical protein
MQRNEKSMIYTRRIHLEFAEKVQKRSDRLKCHQMKNPDPGSDMWLADDFRDSIRVVLQAI